MNAVIKSDFLKFLLHEKGLQEKSAIAYLKHVDYLYRESGKEILDLKGYRDIANIIVQLKTNRGWSDRMTYKTASMTSVFFNWAAREGLIKESPMRLGHGFKKNCEGKIPEFFDWESRDMQKILNNPNNSVRMTTILQVLKSSGIRASELCNLKIADVQDRWLLIRDGKGGRTRYAPIDEECRRWLDIYIPWRKLHYSGEWLFPKEDFSGPINAHGLWKMLYNMGRKMGIRIYPHKFRHSLAGALISNGADVTIAAAILGHKTLSSTRIYAHFKKDQVLQAYDRFSKKTA